MTHKLPPLLTSETAKRILEGKNKISIDLGLSETTIKSTKKGYKLTVSETIGVRELEKIAADPRTIYFVENNAVYKAAISGKHFYKLVKTEGAPTLEIDGIRMHRTKNTTPEKDTSRKLKALGLKGGRVLDTCMGLGYTAIAAHEMHAEYVITIEYEPNVIQIALINPWSSKLFTAETIHKLIGDAYTVVDSLPSSHFDYIIHDPPRHGSSGHLYGLEFYRKLARVLKPGGKLFHYMGEPGSRYRKVNIRRGIISRLNRAGFTNIKYHPSIMGVTCTLGTA